MIISNFSYFKNEIIFFLTHQYNNLNHKTVIVVLRDFFICKKIVKYLKISTECYVKNKIFTMVVDIKSRHIITAIV